LFFLIFQCSIAKKENLALNFYLSAKRLIILLIYLKKIEEKCGFAKQFWKLLKILYNVLLHRKVEPII
jgi:hypothetical protein